MSSPIFTNRYATHPDDVRHYDTDELRQHFLLDNLMQPDVLVLNYTHYERMLVGSAVPVAVATTSKLPVAAMTRCMPRIAAFLTVWA